MTVTATWPPVAPSVAVLLTVVVVAHGLLPRVLTATAHRAARRTAGRGRAWDPRRAWAIATLAAAAAVLAVLLGDPGPDELVGVLGVQPMPLAVVGPLVGVAAGVAFPALAAWLASGAARETPGAPGSRGAAWPFRQRLRPRAGASLVAVAAGEEVVWRLAAPLVLVGVGAGPLAVPLAALGFAALHLPGYGRRRLPYLLAASALFAALGALGGLLSAVACHAAHNLAVATAARPRAHRPQALADSPASAW